MALDLRSPEPDDDLFTYYWELFLPDIEQRDNLKPSHLIQLAILCDLQLQYRRLKTYIDNRGMMYETNGRNGFQRKPNPELAQMNRVIADIRNYSKMLGLVLVKDTVSTKKGPKNDFEDDDED